MTRRTRLVQCALVLGAASLGLLAANGMDAGAVESALGAPTAFSGFAAGVFVTTLVAGTMLLGRAAGQNARAPWLTTALLLTYLLLLATARHRPAVSGVDAVPGLMPTHAGDDTFLILRATLGLLCVLSALADMRRIVRLAPVAVDADWRPAVPEAPAPWSEDASELPETGSLSSLDDELAEVPLMEEASPPDLDAAPPAPAEAIPVRAPLPGSRAKRLFE